MSLAGAALASATALTAGAMGAALLPRARSRVIAVGMLTAAAAAAGMVAATATLAGEARLDVSIPWLLPFGGLHFGLDALGAVFVVAAGLVGVAASVYGIGYAGHGVESRPVQLAFPLFVWTLLLVPAAASVATFLVMWELMALASLVLVVAEHRHNPDAVSAAQWYGAMTHLGLAAILLALVLATGGAAGDSFAAVRAHSPELAPWARSVVFLLALAGFGSKAGMVPLHVWLPRAHPEAPSHVSALMSGAMVKLGVYGIIRVGWDLLGGGPRWWWVLVLALGMVSALFGILHSLMASDLKRLLAYSTTENVGLILIGVGAAGVFAGSGNRGGAALALAAALLHVVNHAAFKGLLFLGAGSVIKATGTRDLDRLGGLMRRMPFTGATFAVGALAIAALPPLNGFASEWLLLQALVHGLPSATVAVVVLVPVAVGTVALTGGLAAAAFVRALGTGFLALPRSAPAEGARESAPTMRAGLGALALACIALGLAPAALAAPLRRAVAVLLPAVGHGGPVAGGLGLRLAGIQSTVTPVALAAALVAAIVVLLGVARVAGARGAVRSVETWGCGRSVQTARMEYTATSFAEPLQRVFDDVVRPDLDLDVSHSAESRYYRQAVVYRRGISDAVERRIYEPVIRAASWWGRWARHIQNGSIHRYLAYAMAALIAVLVVAR